MDRWVFTILQLAYVAFVAYAFFKSGIITELKDYFRERKELKAPPPAPNALKITMHKVNAYVTRSEESLRKFTGVYAFLLTAFTAICLGAESAKPYQMLFLVLDVALTTYLCLFNRWFRNKIIELWIKLRIE